MEVTEHAFVLNPGGLKVAQTVFDGDRLLCGWIADSGAVSPGRSEITCRDCRTARGE